MEARTTMRNMDERSLAEQIEASKDDPEAWGEVEAPPVKRRGSERRQRGAVVSVRLTADELSRIQQYAAETGLSVSGALRDAALAVADAATHRATWRSPSLRLVGTSIAGSSAATASTFTTTSNGHLHDALASAR
jgi:hypothetical protein